MSRNGIKGVASLRKTACLLASAYEVTATTSFGSVFRLRQDYIDKIVLADGYYEPEVLEAMLEAPRGGCVWDVGANFGLHAVTLKRLRPDLRVVCFEPSVDSAARLLAHAAINSVEIDLLPFALGETSGFSTLHTMSGNPGANSIVPWTNANYDGKQSCAVYRADYLIDQCLAPMPDFVKLDIEQGERAFLKGLGDKLPRIGRFIFENGDETERSLRSAGYFFIRPLQRKSKSRFSAEAYPVAGSIAELKGSAGC